MLTSKILIERPVRLSKNSFQDLRQGMSHLLVQANTFALRRAALSPRSQFIFVLSHMRSGSTLLCHLLCSSDEIVGFGETHNNYRRRSELAKLLLAVRRHTGKNPVQYRYVLDKLVGSHDAIHETVLSDRRVRFVFLVREPVASIASIVSMRRECYNDDPDHSIRFATNYYEERIPQLIELAAKINAPERCLLLQHEQLLSKTVSVFQALQTFLQLSAPLREDYEITPTTGQLGIGDPSANIFLGRIDRSLPRKDIALPAETRTRLEQCYLRCVKQLSEMIQTPRIAENGKVA